jgi:RNA polymerase sigma factor (sigma-70 family)
MAAAEPDAAYVEFVTGRMAWLRRFAFLLCRDWHRADDLVQTAVTKLYANWPRAERMENLEAYTRRILVNTYLAEQRAPWWKRVVVHGDRQTLDDASQGALHRGGEVDLEASLDLRDALMRLTPRQRAVLALRYFDDLSVAEAAAALGCSPGNIKKQTWVALGALRASLTVDADTAPEFRADEGPQARRKRTTDSAVRRQGAASRTLMGTGIDVGRQPATPDGSVGR